MLVALTACTMKNQDAPPLTGPSEQGTSLQLIANPDVLTQDGSQSNITVIARGPSGQVLPGLSIRVDVTFKDDTTQANIVTDQMGSLSARNVVTDSNGRADVVYTTRKASDVPETIVGIRFIPVGASTVARTVSIKLLKEGTVSGGGNIDPLFTSSTTTPEVGEDVVFDASESTAARGIASYKWNFGDGHTASGRVVVHAFSSPATRIVKLTVTDPYGESASTTQTITVSAIGAPTADFTWLPDTPTSADLVHFDASASSAAAGHTITRYRWDWGDGSAVTTTSSVVATHQFAAGTYVVTLTVTDDTGQTTVAVKSITVS
jgi:PKD repeat protein